MALPTVVFDPICYLCGMFKTIFQRLGMPAAPPAARTPDNLRLYVVGDVHGRIDLLNDLAARIANDAASAAGLNVGTIFLGDYVDRGPGSAAVLEALSRGDFPTPIIALRGNHEEVLLKFVEDEGILESWRNFGGLETLHSYGVPVTEAMRGDGYDTAREAFLRALPQGHLDFLQQTRLNVSFGDYFFVHAGVKPGVPLDQQVSNDLLWIREEFLRFEGSHGKVVVHGHTPVEKPDMRHNRINVDTGAYASSTLTALVLEGEQRRFLSTRRTS
jgi:serine/threonine protein phosphatase 1